jgi:hypothetical protein
MDISNNQRNLFAVIDRNYLLDGDQGRPHEDGLMIMNYTDRVQANSDANYPHQSYSQLDVGTHIGTFGKGNSQPSKIPTIDCTRRKNETASRFNYAFDYAINNRMIDVSGQHIPNENLRVIPNRGIELCYQDRIIPENKEISKLSQRLLNISRIDNAFKLSPNDLRYKIKNQKLTREELIGLSKTGRTYENSGVLAIPNMPPQVNQMSGITSALRQNNYNAIGINPLDVMNAGYLDLANNTNVKKSSPKKTDEKISDDFAELLRFAAEARKKKKTDAATVIQGAFKRRGRPKKNP